MDFSRGILPGKKKIGWSLPDFNTASLVKILSFV
jgi:hypothetical protein